MQHQVGGCCRNCGTSYLTPVKLKNFFFKNSQLNIWMSMGRRFPVRPVTAPAKGPAELSPIANPGSNRISIRRALFRAAYHPLSKFQNSVRDNERILVSKKLPNDLKMILDQLCQFDSMPIVAVESTLNWYWLVDGLQGGRT